MQSKFLIISTLCLIVFAQASFAEDRIAQRVEAAEGRFKKAVQLVAEKLEAALDEEINDARDDARLDVRAVLEEQKRLYKEQGVIPLHPSLAREVERYCQTLDREGDKLVRMYEHAVGEYIKADEIDAAKIVQERISYLRPMNTNQLNQGKWEKRPLTSDQVIDLFNLPKESLIDSKTIGLRVGTINGYRSLKKSDIFITDAFDFGFLMKARWYHVIGAEIDGDVYFYSRGHWANTDTMVVERGQEERLRDKSLIVNNADRYTPLGLQLKDNTLTWYYDGAKAYAIRLQNKSDLHTVRLIFASHEAELSLRDVHFDSNYEITGSVLKGGASPGADVASDIELLKTATLKHNQLVVTSREQLQKAILQADKEQTIVDAKAAYDQKVTSIKQAYIAELQVTLDKAVAGDRLEVAGRIKTQMLRVRKQLEQLSNEDTSSVVPELDAGGEAASTPDQQTPEANESNDDDDDDLVGGESDNDDVDFFGIPLE